MFFLQLLTDHQHQMKLQLFIRLVLFHNMSINVFKSEVAINVQGKLFVELQRYLWRNRWLRKLEP